MRPDNATKRFAVLLSTYNGAEHLPALLESIGSQSWRHWDLWIRDDGSSDETREILQDYGPRISSDHRIHFYAGENTGAAASFFYLLERAGDGYAGYAFCDQDDLWMPEKLERAARVLEQASPMLYHARQWLFHPASGKRTQSPVPVRAGFSNALVQNQVVGCTMVINARLRRYVLDSLRAQETDSRSPSAIIMHDWWCYLLASGIGTIRYDSEPVIVFRRHDRTATPAAADVLRGGRKRLSVFRKHGLSISHILKQADLLHTYFTSAQPDASRRLPEAHMALLESLVKMKCAGLVRRIVYLFTGKHRRSRLAETFLFRLLVLMRRF